MKHYITAGLFFVSAAVIGDTPPNRMSKSQFEQMFKAADIDKDGVLTRAEAYAKFPKAPKFFDQIDRNKDGYVSLQEVEAAMKRSVDAAITAGVASKRYSGAADTGIAGSGTASGADVPEFASETDAREHHRYRYYDSLVSSEERALERGELIRAEPVPNVLKKPF